MTFCPFWGGGLIGQKLLKKRHYPPGIFQFSRKKDYPPAVFQFSRIKDYPPAIFQFSKRHYPPEMEKYEGKVRYVKKLI